MDIKETFDGWEDPWEQIRLLGDARRNDALVAWLRAEAPRRRLLEIGAGSGLFACMAAKLGAARVIAIEGSPLAEVARALVRENGLEDLVRVERADALTLPPDEPVDRVYAELANADPLVEGWLDAMNAGAAWLTPGGLVAPHQLTLSVALLATPISEAPPARAEVARHAAALGLRMESLASLLTPDEPYRFLAPRVDPLHAPVPVWSVALGTAAEPPALARVRIPPQPNREAHAAAVFFDLDYGHARLSNHPEPGHYGVLVSSFAEPLDAAAGTLLEVRLDPDDDSLHVCPTGAG